MPDVARCPHDIPLGQHCPQCGGAARRVEGRTLGQVGYEAWAMHQSWTNAYGRRMPAWRQVRPVMKAAWEVAAAVIKGWKEAC